MASGRTPTRLFATCESCDWKRAEGSYDAVRMAARRHAKTKGHLVYGHTGRILVWDGRSREARTQDIEKRIAENQRTVDEIEKREGTIRRGVALPLKLDPTLRPTPADADPSTIEAGQDWNEIQDEMGALLEDTKKKKENDDG